MSRSKWKGQYTDHYLLKKIRRIQKISGKQKQKQNKKENITSSSPSKLVDNRDFLTEEK